MKKLKYTKEERAELLEAVVPFAQAKREFERAYVEHLLTLTEGNVSWAARMAKKDRKDFYDVIRRTEVDVTDFRP